MSSLSQAMYMQTDLKHIILLIIVLLLGGGKHNHAKRGHLKQFGLEETKMAMWNEMGNSNTSLKEEGDVSAKATAKSPLDEAPEEAEAVLHLSDEAETTDGTREESTQDEVGRDDMKHEIQQTLAEEPADSPREAEELALDSKRDTGPMDGCVSTVRDGSEKVDTSTLPEVVEEPNRQEHEDGWQGKRITPSVCMSLEDAALTLDTNAESAAAGGGTEKSTKSLLNDTGTETSLVGKGELLGPAEPKAGGLSASNELGSVDGKDSAIASTLPSSANKDDTLEEIDAPLEERISTVEYIREDDDNLMEETDNTLAEMKSLDMGELGDPVQNGGGVTDSIEKARRNSFSSLNFDNAILHRDQSIQLQPDDTRVEDESIVLVKSTDLIGIPSTTDIRKVGGQFECGADRSPYEDALAPNSENTDAHTKIVRHLECPVDEKGALEAVKATEYDIVDEGFPTPREECFVRLTRDISTIAESEEVVDGIAEAEKPTEDTNSGIKSNARVSDEEFQAFDPLKLNQLELFPLPINEEASKVESDVGDGSSREDIEALDSQNHGSKPDKAINLRMKKSPSFDFDLRITSTEESDRTPLLFQDKRVVRTATAMTADYGNAEKKKLPIPKERILSFGHADSRTPSLGFSREEHDAGGFHNHDISEKQEKVLLLDPAKDLEVVDSPSSAEQKGKRRSRSSLFGNCMCCATVMN